MNSHFEEPQESKSESIEEKQALSENTESTTFQFVNQRPEFNIQQKLQKVMDHSPYAKKQLAIQKKSNDNTQTILVTQMQAIVNSNFSQQAFPIQKRDNNTGLPNQLKVGIENLSGHSMDDVRVHYNSDKPSQLNAHAYAQGTNIHLAPGQEKHLPHEAWHVVQQKQGRVQPSFQMKGMVPVNDDLNLEKEADVKGEEALQFKKNTLEDSQVPQQLKQVSISNSSAPVQGVFIRLGRDPSSPDAPREYWKDEDTGEIYYVQKADSNGRIYLSSQNSNVVITQNGIVLERYPVRRHVYDAMEEEEGSQEDSEEDPELPGAPSLINMDEQEDGVINDGGHEGMRALSENFQISKLTTDLTANVAVYPIAEGQSSKNTNNGPTEMRYLSNQVLIKSIFLGDKDRPDTRHDNQESHTVAWTLMRSGLMNLSGTTINEFIAFMIQSFEEISHFVKNEEGLVLLKKVVKYENLKVVNSGCLALDLWSNLCSELLVKYLQVYQLSTTATYKRGKAKGHGEASAMRRLHEDEEKVGTGQKCRAPGKIAVDMAKLLDVQFRVNALGVDEYAYAVFHWITMLHQTFPFLMKNLNDSVLKAVLDKKLAKSFIQELSEDPNDPNTPKTVRELLDKKELVIKHIQKTKSRQLKGSPEKVEQETFNQLKTNFNSNVGLMPIDQGVQQTSSLQLDQQVLSISQTIYNPRQLVVRKLLISNMDRPKTKYISHQRSHTVPWTLARAAILSFNGQPFPALLNFLDHCFTALKGDIRNHEGNQAWDEGIKILAIFKSKSMSINKCQDYLNRLLYLYFIAYQVAQSTTYINPGEIDGAKGHGEGTNMQILRLNDFSLSNANKILNPPGRIIQAALGMFDAIATKYFSEKNIYTAFLNLLHKLRTAFPAVMHYFGEEIIRSFGEEQIGFDGKPLKLIIKMQSE